MRVINQVVIEYIRFSGGPFNAYALQLEVGEEGPQCVELNLRNSSETKIRMPFYTGRYCLITINEATKEYQWDGERKD